MEQAKKYLWESILEDLEINSQQSEKIKHIFKSHEDLKTYLQFFTELKYHNMRDLNSFNNYILETKYHKTKGRVLGIQSKAMPDKVYKSLIDYVKTHFGEKQYLALQFEGIEGPRGEDTVQIKLEDLDFKHHQVRIVNRKAGGHIYEIPLNKKLELDLKKFIAAHIKEIHEHDEFIFFSNNQIQKRDHLSQRYLKDVVRVSLKDLNLYKVYAKSEDGRNLGLYCLHGFREHAGNRVFENSNHNIEKVRELLDHVNTKESRLYIDKPLPEKDLIGLV